MITLLLTIFSNAFHWKKVLVFWLKNHLIVFPVSQYQFGWWLGVPKATSNNSNQWWPSSATRTYFIRPQCVNVLCYLQTFPRYWPFVRGIHLSPVGGTHRSPADSPHKGPVTWGIDVFFVVGLNKPLDKQSNFRWFDVIVMRYWDDKVEIKFRKEYTSI